MSERITAENLDEVVKKNKEIREDMMQKTLQIRTNWNRLQIGSINQLAMQILSTNGLLQIPIDNVYWSGAIFVREGKKIPVINTALSRANQYFTAWHEIYHLIFDEISFSHVIEAETIMEERKADYFASLMLLGNLMSYYSELRDMEFLSKVFYCMSMFQAPYKAVLISLYESASQTENQNLKNTIKHCFDVSVLNMDERFRELGLDDSLVKPSYVINVEILHSKIQERIKKDPELTYNYDNATFLENITKQMHLIMGT